MNNGNHEPASDTSAGRTSWRELIVGPVRNRWPLVAAEPLLILFPFALRALGVIRNASLVLFLIGWLFLWLRREGWRTVGLCSPANWWRTILLGIGIGIAYDAADIFVFLPAIHRLTGEAVQVEQYGELRGHPGTLLLLLALTWTLGALVEEMAYRGYALNRIANLFGGKEVAFVLAAIVVSLLFGYAHVKQGISGVFDNVLAGITFSALYLSSGKNLWLSIIVHGVVDTTSLVLLFLGIAPR